MDPDVLSLQRAVKRLDMPLLFRCAVCDEFLPYAQRLHGLHECTGRELRAVVRPQNEVGQIHPFCCPEEAINCMLLPHVPGKQICQPFPCKAVRDVEEVASSVVAAPDIGYVCLPQLVGSCGNEPYAFRACK